MKRLLMKLIQIGTILSLIVIALIANDDHIMTSLDDLIDFKQVKDIRLDNIQGQLQALETLVLDKYAFWKEEIRYRAQHKNKPDYFNDHEDADLTKHTLIQVDGGDLSGHRQANVVVDIGYGARKYYAYTNAYGQLVKVTAKEIILQDEDQEPVLSTGRYYRDEAKVPGVESKTLDEGHIIADSLGGVSNAYNITPQNSTLNRHGDQAYMEKIIRDADGCTDFLAIITYPDTKTQIPSHYSFTYTINGRIIQDAFDNVNPDQVNKNLD